MIIYSRKEARAFIKSSGARLSKMGYVLRICLPDSKTFFDVTKVAENSYTITKNGRELYENS